MYPVSYNSLLMEFPGFTHYAEHDIYFLSPSYEPKVIHHTHINGT